MNKYLRNAVISLIILFALFGALAGATGALTVLGRADLFLLAWACLFSIGSIVIWVISWAYLVRKRHNVPYSKLAEIGFSSVYGALTPIQLGAEALRSILLKNRHNVPYSDSISASMVAKGAKFLVILIAALIVFFLFLCTMPMGIALLIAFLSGFAVIALAVLVFLAPFNKALAGIITSCIEKLSGRISFISPLHRLTCRYVSYLSETKSSFLLILALSLVSWALEVLALQFSFLALGISLYLRPLLILAALASILERAPFLPRGIGAVEFVGAYVLFYIPNMAPQQFSLGEIAAVLILFDVVRLVVPTILSILFAALSLKFPEQGKYKEAVN